MCFWQVIIVLYGLRNLNQTKFTLQVPDEANSPDQSDKMASNYFKGSSTDSQYIHADTIIVALSEQ